MERGLDRAHRPDVWGIPSSARSWAVKTWRFCSFTSDRGETDAVEALLQPGARVEGPPQRPVGALGATADWRGGCSRALRDYLARWVPGLAGGESAEADGRGGCSRALRDYLARWVPGLADRGGRRVTGEGGCSRALRAMEIGLARWVPGLADGESAEASGERRLSRASTMEIGFARQGRARRWRAELLTDGETATGRRRWGLRLTRGGGVLVRGSFLFSGERDEEARRV
jgi:hypothetical protein